MRLFLFLMAGTLAACGSTTPAGSTGGSAGTLTGGSAGAPIGGSGAGSTGGMGVGGDGGGVTCAFSEEGAGELMDFDEWVATTDGEEFFGTPPEDAMCETTDELGYRAEELGGTPVFSVSTDFCNWITVAQPSRRWVRQGEQVQLRFRTSNLTAPQGGRARTTIVIGDEVMWERFFAIPGPTDFITFEWTAPKDFPPCTQLLFHVDNHGANEYSIVNLDVL